MRNLCPKCGQDELYWDETHRKVECGFIDFTVKDHRGFGKPCSWKSESISEEDVNKVMLDYYFESKP